MQGGQTRNDSAAGGGRGVVVASAHSAEARPSTFSLLESSGPPPGTPRELLLEVHINEQSEHETDMFISLDPDPDKSLYARGADMKRWRLHPPDVKPLEYAGDKFYPLKAIPGLSYSVDMANLTVQITAPASAFSGTYIDGLHQKNPPPQPTPLGGFLNYDFLGTHGAAYTNINGLFEAGLFNNWGTGTSTFLDQNIGRAHSHLIRLDTAWRHDNPGAMTTLTLGDSITRGGMTGLSVRMAGIQFGTNFATRPYFLTFPIPSIGGQASLPSTVSLYVDGLLKKTQNVPPGPFSVPFVPVLTGPGTIRLVVRDALGHEQIVTTSFYASSQLLTPGLNDYSISVGKLRENYGYESNNYGPLAATGLFRHGFSDALTGEIRGEASSAVQDFGLGVNFATTSVGVLNAAFAFSHGNLGRGALGLLGWQRQWKHFNLGAQMQLSSPEFTELGYNGQPAPRRQVIANAGAFFRRVGSFSLAYIDQTSPLYGRTRFLNAGYGVGIGRRGYLNLNAFHSLGGESDNGISLSFSLAFGERSSATVGVSQQNHILQAQAQVQKSLPIGTGDGYQLSAGLGSNSNLQANYAYQNNYGTWLVGATSIAGNMTYNAEARGGLAFLGGEVFPSRQINGAFGVVEVPGISGVTVYSDNHPVAVTDKRGYALIPSMRPYQYNSISLSAEELPLSAQVPTLQLDAVPRAQSAVIIKFPITTTRGGTLNIVLEDGKPLPAGAIVQIAGQSQQFPVGLNGEVYLTGLSEHNTIEAIWKHQHCEISFKMPKTNDPLPDLGTFTCKGIHQ